MIPDSEAALRKSLDSIDSIRRRIASIGWLVAVINVGIYLWLAHVASTSGNPKRILMTAVLALSSMIATATFALALFILRMTKRILRAIDFATANTRDSGR